MKVVIFDDKIVPGLGQGPFLDPIFIPDDKYFLYKRLGYRIVNVSSRTPLVESGLKNAETYEINISNLNDTERAYINKLTGSNIPMRSSRPITEEIKKDTSVNIIEEDNTESKTLTTDEEETVEDTSDIIIEEDSTIINEEDSTNIEEETVEDFSEEIVEDSIEKENNMEEDTEEIDLQSLSKRQIISLLEEENIEVDNKMNRTQLIAFAEEKLS